MTGPREGRRKGVNKELGDRYVPISKTYYSKIIQFYTCMLCGKKNFLCKLRKIINKTITEAILTTMKALIVNSWNNLK